MGTKKEIFVFKSVSITPNPVNTKGSVLVQIELEYNAPFLDYPYDFQFDFKQPN